MKSINKLTTTSMLIACAAALQILESPLPRFLPWLKPGLANSLSLYAIIRFSPATGILIASVRSIAASLIMGTLFSPVFYMSFTGAVSSAIIMSLLKPLYNKKMINIDILSISGALTSNLSQLAVIQFLFAQNLSLWLYLSLMIWVAIPAGLIISKIVKELLNRSISLNQTS